jgi:hypothetical protein
VGAALLAGVLLVIDNGIKKQVLSEAARFREEIRDAGRDRDGKQWGGAAPDGGADQPGVDGMDDLDPDPGAQEAPDADAPVTGDPESRRLGSLPHRSAGGAGGSPIKRP